MRQDLCEEAKQHFNEPILIGFDLCRCVGYAEDDEDCYLIVRHPRIGFIWHTFVGGYTYLNCLKGQGVAGVYDDLTRLDVLLELNGVPKEDEFVFKIKGTS